MSPGKLDSRLEAIENSLRGLEEAVPGLSSNCQDAVQELSTPVSDLQVSFDFSVGWLEGRLTDIDRKADYTQLLLCRVLKEIKHVQSSREDKTVVSSANQVPPSVLNRVFDDLDLCSTEISETNCAVDGAVASGDLAAIPSGGLGGHTVVPGINNDSEVAKSDAVDAIRSPPPSSQLVHGWSLSEACTVAEMETPEGVEVVAQEKSSNEYEAADGATARDLFGDDSSSSAELMKPSELGELLSTGDAHDHDTGLFASQTHTPLHPIEEGETDASVASLIVERAEVECSDSSEESDDQYVAQQLEGQAASAAKLALLIEQIAQKGKELAITQRESEVMREQHAKEKLSEKEAIERATVVAATGYRKAISKLCDEAGLSACLQPLFDTVDAKPKEQQVAALKTVYDKLRQSQ